MNRQRLQNAFLAVVVVVLVVFAFPSLAGASATATVPWGSIQYYTGSTTEQVPSVGQCNEVMVAADYQAQNGYEVQIACQYYWPVGTTLLPEGIAPNFPQSSECVYETGSSYSCGSGAAGWSSQVATADPYNGTPVSGSGTTAASCEPSLTATGVPQPDMWVASNEGAGSLGDVYCSNYYLGNPDASLFPGGAFSWAMRGQVQSISVGPSEVGSDGHSYEAVQEVEDWYFNNFMTGTFGSDVVGGSCTPGGCLAVTPGVGDFSLLEGVKCSTLSLTDGGGTINGVTMAGATGLSFVGAPGHGTTSSTTPSYYPEPESEEPYDEVLQLDTINCSDGPQAVQHVQMPSTYYTGGSSSVLPTGGVAAPCTLDGVTLGATSFNVTSGDSYSVTFDYSGTVDQIAVDPDDGATGQYIDIGTPGDGQGQALDSDSTVATATGSPQTVSYTPTATGLYVPEFWCVANGYVYDWGNGVGDANIGSGTGGSCGTGCAPVGTGSTSDLDACFASAGWDLYNPVTWVLGSLHDTYCIVVYLAVPPQSQLTDSLLGVSAFTSHVPGLWVADAVDAANTVVAGVNTGIASGDCTAPTINPDFATFGHGGAGIGFKMPEPATCSGESSEEGEAGSLFGWRGPLRDVLVFGVWAAVFLVCWRMMPFSRPGDGAEVVAGWSEDGYRGTPIETVYTNEESTYDA